MTAFRTTEAAVFAVMANDEPNSVRDELSQLYIRLRIRLAHARVLRTWGERGAAPNPKDADHAVWTEAIAALDVALKKKGIVA